MPSDDDLMWADVCALREAYELRCHVMNHTIIDSIFTVWAKTKAWELNCRNEDDPEFPERYVSTVPDYDAISFDRHLAITPFTPSAIVCVHYHYGEVPC